MEATRTVELSRKVRAARVLSGKDVTELAAALGISERAYYRLEDAKRGVSALELETIALETRQSIGFFFPSLVAAEGGTLSPSFDEVKASFPSDHDAGEALKQRIAEESRS